MCHTSDALPWFALAVSVVSASFASAAWWTNREKLRLDLYNRRFDVYSRTLDFYHALLEWKPTELEKTETSLQDSQALKTTQRNFIKAGREAGFLFDDASGIQKQLEQMHADSIGIIGFRRDLIPKLIGKPEFASENKKCDECWKRLHDAIPSLEQKMSLYLDFHTLLSWSTVKKR
jgi:hypothetical protein